MKKRTIRSLAGAVGSAVGLVSSAVGMVLSAAHTKKDMINLRHQRWNEFTGQKEKKMSKFEDGLKEYRNTPDALLLDVRERDDYREGHIPGAVHAELRRIQNLEESPETPIFIYCYRGTRSAMAAAILKEAGFEHVKDIGGIDWYSGELTTD